MIGRQDKNAARKKRHLRIRKRMVGTESCPRMGVFRSHKHIYAQLIDDTRGVTLVSASSVDPELRSRLGLGANVEAAREVGRLVAERALAKGIEEIVFDRSGYIYHGRVAALADAAREAGLRF